MSTDGAGDLVAIHDRGGGVARCGYDRHLLVEDRSADGYAYYFCYDAKKRCIHVWGEDGYLARALRYDSVQRRTWEINGEGESTIYRHTATCHPLSVERMGGHRVDFNYDDDGRLLSRHTCGALDGAFTYRRSRPNRRADGCKRGRHIVQLR